jgi:hypothetical protein
VVAGTFLIVGLGEEDFTSITPEHASSSKKSLYTRMFMRLNGRLVVLPMEVERAKARKRPLAKLNDMKGTDAPTAQRIQCQEER